MISRANPSSLLTENLPHIGELRGGKKKRDKKGKKWRLIPTPNQSSLLSHLEMTPHGDSF